MQVNSLSRSCARFLSVLLDLQDKSGGPVSLTSEQWEEATGIPVEMQVRVRQKLMLSGLLRLSAANGQWVYSLEDVS